MKKLFLVSIVCFLFSFVYSQNKNLRMSLVASPQISWLKSDYKNVDKDGSTLGINAGLNVDYFFTDNYGVVLGLTISTMGGKLNYMDSIPFKTADKTLLLESKSGSKVRYRLQYLEMPISLKFKTNEIGYITYFGQLGLTPMFNIGAKADISADNFGIDKEKINKEVNVFNAAYHIGGGLEYNLGGNTSVIAGLFYTQGFVDVTTNIDNQEIDGIKYSRKKDKTTLGSVMLKLGIMF